MIEREIPMTSEAMEQKTAVFSVEQKTAVFRLGDLSRETVSALSPV